MTCAVAPRVPADARLTAAHFAKGPQGERYVFDPDVPFGLPFRPTPFTATFTLDDRRAQTCPRRCRCSSDPRTIFAARNASELHVVPKFAVNVSPEVAIVPLAAGSAARRDVRVTVTNHSEGAASARGRAASCRRAGASTPASAPVAFTREDEQITVKFTVQPRPVSEPVDAV